MGQAAAATMTWRRLPHLLTQSASASGQQGRRGRQQPRSHAAQQPVQPRRVECSWTTRSGWSCVYQTAQERQRQWSHAALAATKQWACTADFLRMVCTRTHCRLTLRQQTRPLSLTWRDCCLPLDAKLLTVYPACHACHVLTCPAGPQVAVCQQLQGAAAGGPQELLCGEQTGSSLADLHTWAGSGSPAGAAGVAGVCSPLGMAQSRR